MSSLCRRARRHAVLCVPPSALPLDEGAVHGAKLVAAVATGATAGNRRGIDVASVNEGANIGRSLYCDDYYRARSKLAHCRSRAH